MIAFGKIAISLLSAFAIVYFRFPFRDFSFWMIFVTLMLPVEVRILPTYKVVSDLGMLDSYAGLTLPLIASATATFLFRQFFLTIPDELAEAARIDGAGPMRFFWDVVVPLSKTNIAALFVILFIYGWNQYLWPLLVTTSEDDVHGGDRHQAHDRRRRGRHRVEPRHGDGDARDAAAGARRAPDAEVVRQGPGGHREDSTWPKIEVMHATSARATASSRSSTASTLTVADGEFIVIVGPSGCGKSTLLRMVAGLEAITAGEIAIGERVVNTLEPKDRDIAMVFQNYALYPHMSVFDNMAYGLKIRGCRRTTSTHRVKRAAAILELGPLLERKPRQLSGGQRQRVAMGRAIVREPAVFLFDEPLSNLDAKLRVQMRFEIQKLHRRLKTTSLYVTHDQVEAMTLAHRMIVMNAGRAEQIGTPMEVYENPATLFVAGFIGSPAMNLFEGRVTADGRAFEVSPDMPIPLPEVCTALAGRELVLGVRPEHLQPGGEHLTIEIETVEVLGAEHLIHGLLAGQEVIVRTGPEIHPPPGMQLPVRFAASAVHWFDPATRARISA